MSPVSVKHITGHHVKGDLRKMMSQNPIPTIAPGTVNPASMSNGEPTRQANSVLAKLNAAISSKDAEKLEGCFYPDQAYWKDLLAMTYHTRTFSTPGTIAASFLETANLRELVGEFRQQGEAVFIPATPVLVRALPPLLHFPHCAPVPLFRSPLTNIQYSNSLTAASTSRLDRLPPVVAEGSCSSRSSRTRPLHGGSGSLALSSRAWTVIQNMRLSSKPLGRSLTAPSC
jgi:hypothetical protein